MLLIMNFTSSVVSVDVSHKLTVTSVVIFLECFRIAQYVSFYLCTSIQFSKLSLNLIEHFWFLFVFKEVQG